MDFGIVMFATDYAIAPDELARAAEERGFESLWFPEHTHIPASRKSPWPGGPELPKDYWHTHDLFVALAMAAAATKKLKIGSGICLVVERDPIMLAKEVATLDFLSNGRFLFGIGGGWNVEEMANHGTRFSQRWKLLRERIEAMKVIWREDEAADTTASWSTSIPSGRGRSRRRSRTRRSCSAATAPRRWTASCATATAGCRSPYAPARCPTRSPISAGAPAQRDAIPTRSRSACTACRPMRTHCARMPLPARSAASSPCRSAERDKVLPLLDRYAAVMAELRRALIGGPARDAISGDARRCASTRRGRLRAPALR